MPYRVIQWSTGNVGRYALRQILDHPELTLAGVFVSSEAKDGRDAGELCQRPATGVRATRDVAALLPLALAHSPGCAREPTGASKDFEAESPDATTK